MGGEVEVEVTVFHTYVFFLTDLYMALRAYEIFVGRCKHYLSINN
jgi:hypothetical protein